MTFQKGDSHEGDGLHLPPKQEHKSTVISLHGLGDTADGWADFGLQLQTRSGPFAHTKFIFPTAPTRRITINGGMPMPGWSDVIGLTDSAPEDKVGLSQSVQRVSDIIEKEISSGVAPTKIVLGGFSQGGAIAYLTGLTYKTTLGGIVACSSWLPMGADTVEKLTDASKKTPILHCHGDADPIVSHAWGTATRDLLLSHGIEVEFKAYPGMGHSACNEELATVGDFIQSVIKEH